MLILKIRLSDTKSDYVCCIKFSLKMPDVKRIEQKHTYGNVFHDFAHFCATIFSLDIYCSGGSIKTPLCEILCWSNLYHRNN